MDEGQLEIPLFVALKPPAAVPEEVLATFTTTADAIRWAYEHRDNPGGKPVAWLAAHLGMRRQRLSRILNHGDFKLDPALVSRWDCLVGNSAVSQYVELQKRHLLEERKRVINHALDARLAA